MFEFNEPSVPEITAKEVRQAIDTKQQIVLLDVRTVGEFSRGKITGAINVPVDVIFEKIESEIPDKTAIIYVYCLSGSRSVFAVAEMVQLGYQHVSNMTSGLLAWRAEGYTTS